MKKNVKRWLALILAVAMVSGTCLAHADGFLAATDGEETQVTQESAQAVADEAGGEDEQLQQEPVEEKQEIVIPKKEEASEEAAPETPKEKAGEVSLGQKVDVVPSENKENVYQAVFHRPAVEGGTLRVWTEGSDKKDVTYTNGKYVEEVPEGTTLYFEIEIKGNYLVDSVKDQNGAEIAPTNVSGNVTSYKMVIKENKELTIMYKEAPVKSEEKDAVTEDYTLHINHVLETNIGNFVDEKEIKLTEKDFVKGKYDLSALTYKKEGIVVSSAAQAVSKSDFDEQHEATCQITYAVADGWKAVRKSEISFFSIYVGTFDDVEIVPEGQIPVTIRFVYEDGTLAKTTETVMVTEGENSAYSFSYKVELPEGYTMTAEPSDIYAVNGNVVSATLPAGTKRSEVQLTFVANTVPYKVIDKFPGLTPDGGVETERKNITGKVGELTEVEPLVKEGFTAEPVEQQEIKADGKTVVTVEYRRNEYAVTYDTQGGSYIKAKKGLYEEKVDVYKETAGEDVLTCEKEVHTHSAKPDFSWEQSECYTYKSTGLFSGDWVLTCGKEEHTHTDACYTNGTAWDVTPTRQGYTFDGWYKDAACTEKADEKVVLTDNVTVYAKWIPKNVNYTIAYFKQVWDNNTNSAHYVYDSSRTASGTVGETVKGSDDKTIDYQHFASADSAVIKADGSTVVKVYYDLDEYTIKFNLNNRKAQITINEKTYKNSEYSFKAHIGEDVSDRWPTAGHISGNSTTFYGWKTDNSPTTYVSKRFELTTDMVKGMTTEYKAQYQGDLKRIELHYMLENADGNGYTDEPKYRQEAYSSNNFEAKEIYGFEKEKSKTETENGVKHQYFYYTRAKYNIEYKYNDESLTAKKEIRFGADISGSTYNYTPNRPSDLDEDYQFKGWYDNSEGLGDPYTFNKMPGNNLVLYAIWEAPEKTVTLIYNYGSKEEKVTVKKGDIASVPTPTREGYEFEGWYMDEDFKEEFDVNAPITKDITVYAKWKENKYTTYTVRYVVKKGDNFENIVDAKTVSGSVGQTVKEKAKAFTEGEYSTYAVDAPSKTLKLKAAASENVIMFVYTAPTDLKYKVQYTYNDKVIEKTNFIEAEAANFNVYPDPAIADKLQKEKGYLINETFKNAKLVSDNDENIVEFTLSLEEYKITYLGLEGITGWKGSEGTKNPNPPTYTVENEITIKNPEKTGYVFEGWNLVKTTDESNTHDGKNVVIERGSRGHLTFEAIWSPANDTAYKVEHYQQNLNDDEFTLVETENLKGITDTEATAQVKTFAGFKFDESAEGTKLSGKIAGDGSLVLKLYYTRNSYTVTYKYEGTVPAGASKLPAEATYKYGADVKVAADATAPGYTFNGWDKKDFTMPAENVEISGSFTANENTAYKVEHYQENLNDGGYTLKETENLKGTTDTEVTAEAKTYEGFTLDKTVAGTVESGIVAGDGSLVLKLYYTRNSYKVTYKYEGTVPTGASKLPAEATYKYGAEVKIAADATAPGYTFNGWDKKDFTMPAGDVEITGSFTAKDDTGYVVKFYYQNQETGKYEIENAVNRTGTTDTIAKVTKEDKVPQKDPKHYYFNENAGGTKLEGNINGDESLELKVYFSLQYKVTGRIDNGGTVTNSNQTVKYDAQSTQMKFAAAQGYIIDTIKVNGVVQEVKADQTEYIYPEESSVREDIEVVVTTVKENPEFTSKKELTNAGTGFLGKFKVGETATFDITVENTGNVTLNSVTVTEQLEGAVIKTGTGYQVVDGKAYINTLKIGETVVVKAEYQITQEDIDNGGTSNAVTVEGKGPGTTDPDPEKPKEEIPTDDKKPEAITAKSLTNKGTGENGSFKAGETATFDITVKNTGNVTLKDVIVEEQLEGARIVAGDGYTVSGDDKTATVGAIEVGKTVTVKAEYTVTQTDVDNGGVQNIAAVEIPGGTDPQPPTEEIPTDTHKPEFTATKELTSAGTGKDGAFKVGETATFDITVENTGNVTLSDVVVTEQLEGARIVAGDGYRVRLDGTAIINTLAVGDTVVVKAEYMITQEDIDNGGTSNAVTVEGKGPGTTDPDPEKPGTDIPTEAPDPSMSVNKTMTSTNAVYRVGDTITYQIAVTNTGNVTLNNVVVADTLYNAAGEVTFAAQNGVTFNGNKATIASIAPNETVTLNCSYVVTRADAGNEIINTAVGDSDETDPTDPSTTDPADVEDIYNLTINYVYADGRTAAPSVRAQYLEGESYGYTSPTINGYTPNYAFVRTGAEGMPARDVVVTVVYTAIPTPTTPTTPATPTTPTTPGGGTTAAPADGTPVGAEVRANEDGDVEVVPVVEEDVPLAKRDLDDHKCCILHFLLMLAAMIIYAAYTRSMKKRQERIAELAEELETEKLKREQQESAE